MLTIKNLSVSTEGKTILHDINLVLEKGKTYALLGPNGSGKSTLANVIAGHPHFTVDEESEIIFDGQPICHSGLDPESHSEEGRTFLSPDKRALLGIFFSFQSPLALAGVTVNDLLRLAVGKKMNALELRQLVGQYAEELRIPDELLKRSLNDGFSGGEKKKMEVLQWAVLEPKLAIFDEVDTGVDVDALDTIAQFLKKHRKKDQTFVFITHSTKLLKVLEPDETIVIQDGKIARQDKGKLAIKIIEKEGFETKRDI